MPQLPQISACYGCGCCADACPQSVITLQENEDGFFMPKVDAEKCIECGYCEKKCPALTDTQHRNKAQEIRIMAGWSTDKELVLKSASGGVFAQLAQDFLLQADSVVFGAELLPNNEVVHVAIERQAELYRLQQSKYKQSNSSGIYRQVKEYLQAGKLVLFSGTPCQVAALYSFLGKNAASERLWTVEIICHGVPSGYLTSLACKVNNAERIIAFRTKSKGWERGNRLVYQVKNKRQEAPRFRLDFYSRAYHSQNWLRPSCSNCAFAQVNRVADITLGDYWGAPHKWKVRTNGVSLVLANNKRGWHLLQASNRLILHGTSWNAATQLNLNLYKPTKQAGRYAHHIHQLKRLPFFVQKVIFQSGFSNKWLFGCGQLLAAIGDVFTKRERMHEEKQRVLMTKQLDETIPRVGILTTYFAANFGAMLQPYALMRVLEDMGADVRFVRYKQKAVYDAHRALAWGRITKGGLGNTIANLLALPFTILQDRRMQHFKRIFLKTNDSFEHTIPADLDFYVFGSDQIWNPRNTNGFDDVYFGDFPTKNGAKKIAYAASGECIEDTKANREYLSKKLANFDAIAVREESLRSKLTEMTDKKDIEVVLDPTLLATKDILDELPEHCVMNERPYVLLYHVRQCVPFLKRIHEFARKRGCNLLIISSTPKKAYLTYSLKNKDVTYLPAAGMEDFLGAVRHAEYVFTPSFHGNVFSIVYGRKLYSMALGDGLDTRAADLLAALGMSNRIISAESDWDNLENTEYADVWPRLNILRNLSMDYLKRHLI